MINEQTQNLAERIALLLQEDKKGSDDLSFVRRNLEKINERLDKIESQISFQNSNAQAVSQNSNSPLHPSQSRFENLEEFSHQTINSSPNEKACPFEPAGKPCDHCSMCSARGF
jgi:hypothetical protein